MKLSKASQIMKGEFIGQDAHFFGASTDTRTLSPGQIFFAWKGESFDSHDFLESVESKGAIAAVVERRVVSAEIAQIVVKNSQKALGLLAKDWRKNWKGQCIALTGSNGKTTLKEMLYAILSRDFSTLATQGNLNNHVGCPLTLLQLTDQHQYAVIEMGANHPNEINYLTKIAQPNIAIINNAGACHLEGFGSISGVAEAKSEIFNGLALNGIGIINKEDLFCDFWITKLDGRKYLTFGLSPRADVYATNIDQSNFTLNFEAQSIDIVLPLFGQHNILNALASAAASFAAGISIATIKAGLESIQPVSGRLQKIKLSDNITLVNDGYNANPNSLKAGIDAIFGANRWLVLGNMAELGSDEIALHIECGQYAKQQGFSKLFALGHLAKSSADAFKEGGMSFIDHESLLSILKEEIKNYRSKEPLIILVKGSHSMNMQYFIDAL